MAAYGIRVVIEEPDYVPISMTIQLTLSPGAVVASTALAAGAESQIRAYVGNLRPGDTITSNLLRLAALQSHGQIEDAAIIELCIDRRPVMIQDWTLGDEQVFLPDDRFSDPIRVI